MLCNMTIRNILTHFVKSIQCNEKNLSNTWKFYSQLINQMPLTYFTDSFYQYKIYQLCTSENYYPSSINDRSWKIIKKYRTSYPVLLKTQFKTTMLRWQHDSEFNLESFKNGSKQAISVITKSLHENKNTNTYLSFNANQELERTSHLWNSSVRKYIALEPYQILQILILEVNSIKLTDAMLYQINTLGVGYKEFDNSLLEIILQAKFERVYSDSVIPEWNVTQFILKRMKHISIT